MSIIAGYNDPTIGQKNYDNEGNPIAVEMQPETHTIKNGKITLIQVPSEDYRVQIDGMTELYRYDDTPLDATKYRVDYNTGIIMFDNSLEGQQVTINRYYGDGYYLISATRIYTKLGDSGEVVQTLGDIVEEGKESLDAYGGIVQAITDAETKTTTLNNKILEGNTTEQNLDDSILAANTKNTELNNTIDSANTTKTNLDGSITLGQQTKSDLDTSIANGDVANIQNDLTLLKQEIEQPQQSAPISTTDTVISLPSTVANTKGQVSVNSIKGNTIFQLADNGVNYEKWVNLSNATLSNNGITFTDTDTGHFSADLPIKLKPNTQYTLLSFVSKNDASNKNQLTLIGGVGKIVGTNISSIPCYVGINKLVFTTKADLLDTDKLTVYYNGVYFEVGQQLILKINLLEGDWTNKEVHYLSYGTNSTVSERIRVIGGKNFVKNGNAEEGLISWKFGTGGSAIIENGKFKVTTTSVAKAMFQTVKVKPNTNYNIKAIVENGTVTPTIRAFIKDSTTVLKAGDGTFNAGNNEYIDIGCNLGGLGFAYFSQILLEEVKGQTLGVYESHKDGGTQYIDWEGRSLPNGVFDEVRVSEGKKYQRISNDIDLGSPNLITTTGVNNDLYRFTFDVYKFNVNGYQPVRLNGRIFTYDTNDLNDDLVAFQWTYRISGGQPYFRVPKGYVFSNHTLNYQLAQEQVTDINIRGSLGAYPNGTIIREFAVGDVGFYNNGITINNPKLPIQSIDELYKVNKLTGDKLRLDTSKCVIAGDGLSFTHPDLSLNDLVDYDYYYPSELSTIGEFEYSYPENVAGVIKSHGDSIQRHSEEIKNHDSMLLGLALDSVEKDNALAEHQADMESQHERMKGFYADLEAYYGNTKLISDFQDASNWVFVTGGESSTDTANVKIGKQSFKLAENDNNSGSMLRYMNIDLDLTVLNNGEASTVDDYITAVLYISDVAKISPNVQILFSQALNAGTTDIMHYPIPVAHLVSGWNFIKLRKTDFIKAGNGAWTGIKSIRVSWTSAANAQGAYVSFQLLQLVKKDPLEDKPNPFQRNGVRDFTVNSGEWFVGKEFGKVILRELSVLTSSNNALLGTVGFDDFIITGSIMKDNIQSDYEKLCMFYYDSSNYAFLDISGSVIRLTQASDGTSSTIYGKWLNPTKGDVISGILEKYHGKLRAKVYYNGEFYDSLELDTSLNVKGYLAIATTVSRPVNTISMSITEISHAHHADIAEVAKGLTEQAAARVYNAATYQSIPNATITTINFDSVRWDNRKMFDASKPNRLTIRESGLYSMVANIRFSVNSTGVRWVSITVNGITVALQRVHASSTERIILNIATQYQLKTGDYVEVAVYQDSGVSLSIEPVASYSPEFMVAKIG